LLSPSAEPCFEDLEDIFCLLMIAAEGKKGVGVLVLVL
jgi:hypothetical protein